VVRVLACHAKCRGFESRLSRLNFIKNLFMIQTGTFLTVVDNSGASQVECIKVLNGSKRRYAFMGDTILVSVKKLRPRRRRFSRVKKGELYKAIIVNTKVNLKYSTNDTIKFLTNSVFLLSRQNKLVSTRILTPLPFNFRQNQFMKYIALSKGFIS
jgi:large subunit ribosomal protein L14